jgi:hypothetical protein
MPKVINTEWLQMGLEFDELCFPVRGEGGLHTHLEGKRMAVLAKAELVCVPASQAETMEDRHGSHGCTHACAASAVLGVWGSGSSCASSSSFSFLP